GVGSWCVEALVRTGIGHLTLIDGDTSAVSNTNRQLHAMEGNYGRPKADCLRERALLINPDCCVEVVQAFVTADNAEQILPERADWVVDCIDDLRAKASLVAAVKKRGQSVVVSGGAGARIDPSRVTECDLAHAKGDPLLGKLRTDLRHRFGFPRGKSVGQSQPFGIRVVYSDEPLRQPGLDSLSAIGASENNRIGFGSAAVVTGTVGLRLAAVVLNDLAKD
ncbi:UBA/THIF-type NAD/FAD binding protein, partial [gut metagenome]